MDTETSSDVQTLSLSRWVLRSRPPALRTTFKQLI